VLINSAHFGNIEIPEGELISFPEGIYGFEDLKRWALLGKVEEESSFMWLHAIDDPKICFVVIDPFVIRKDYLPEPDEGILAKIETDNAEDLRVLAIVTVPEDVKRMTANLKSPILINSAKNIAVQMVMDTDKYTFKHYILDEIEKTA